MSATSYESKTTHHRNPIVAGSHRRRLSLALKLIERFLPQGGSVIDFGAGEGSLMLELKASRPDARRFVVEPYMQVRGDTHVLKSSSEVDFGADVITAFEVLEHLEPGVIDEFFALASRGAKDGVIIVSVPNMLGPIIVPKAANAWRSRHTWRYSILETLKAAVLLKGPAERGYGDTYLNHRGFDWRTIRDRVARDFEIIEERHAPLPWLWWGFNSQYFVVFRNR